eukprot:2337326-Amphidinium_carterae.1
MLERLHLFSWIGPLGEQVQRRAIVLAAKCSSAMLHQADRNMMLGADMIAEEVGSQISTRTIQNVTREICTGQKQASNEMVSC